MSDCARWDSGSRWNRWEPHIHAPGTILNDQFKGDWEGYLTAIERSAPTIVAIGITEYYLMSTYERVCEYKASGRLPDCELIFPNVELRLNVATSSKSYFNIHLLISPEDPNHVAEVERFLSRLTFQSAGETFACTAPELQRLGRVLDQSLEKDSVALEQGCDQFKVDFEQLRREYHNSVWARENVAIAISGQKDGSSGLQAPADTLFRAELERFAHVIFASSPKQREFWLGLSSLAAENVQKRYGSLKPCLHGSDAHDVNRVGVPDGGRYSWIKGAPVFDALRQAIIDPTRAFVGEATPGSTSPSQTISSVHVTAAPWIQPEKIYLNPGLVAIIGARGSGKTALADILAAGCDALPSPPTAQSFVYRARKHLSGARVKLEWGSGEVDNRGLEYDASADEFYCRARYLTQQFVDDLCASDGVSDKLVDELERVVFEAHPPTERDSAIDFSELRAMRSVRFRQSRERDEAALSAISERIAIELTKRTLFPSVQKQLDEKSKQIALYERDRSALIQHGTEERVRRLRLLSAAAEERRGSVRALRLREHALLALSDETRDIRQNRAPGDLRDLKARYNAAALNDDDWTAFLLQFHGNVDAVVSEKLKATRHALRVRTGEPLTPTATELIAQDADLSTQSLAHLEHDISLLERQINLDRQTAAKYSAMSKRIQEESAALANLRERVEDHRGAGDRARALRDEREQTYRRVFENVLAEQSVLEELYRPVRDRLLGARGALRKLTFSIRRTADVEAWAAAGEGLLDLRLQGTFRGRGTLLELAQASLKSAWERGDADDILAAMKRFREEHEETLLRYAKVRREDSKYRQWATNFALWLFSTSHIALRYTVQYDGVEIQSLSPGTRGIVLLLLYLSLDDADDRPLIIDQPEENLDPRSVYDELVPLFNDAKGKRQVIIVTHNANLVVNADADQVIIASAGEHEPGALPPISYTSGGLEQNYVRRAVCEVLEGGEAAFKERARRLRITLSR